MASAGLGRYFHLVRELALTNFRLKYTGSVLGYVWSLIKPLAYFGVLYVMFVQLFGQRQNDFPLQLLLGVVVYTFFSEATSLALGSIAGNSHLIRKASLPLSALTVSATVTALLTFAINLVLVMVIVVAAGKFRPSPALLAVPLLLVELYALALGVGMMLASAFVFFRDFGQVWEVLSSLLLYAVGVVFPALRIPPRLRPYFFADPLAQIIEDLRHALITPAAPWSLDLAGIEPFLLALALAAGCLGAGLLLFNRLAPYFAESL